MKWKGQERRGEVNHDASYIGKQSHHFKNDIREENSAYNQNKNILKMRLPRIEITKNTGTPHKIESSNT